MARITKNEIIQASFSPPRTWRAWRIQLGESVIVVAVLLGFFALFTNHTPWVAALVWWPVAGLFSAAATARRRRRARYP